MYTEPVPVKVLTSPSPEINVLKTPFVALLTSKFKLAERATTNEPSTTNLSFVKSMRSNGPYEWTTTLLPRTLVWKILAREEASQCLVDLSGHLTPISSRSTHLVKDPFSPAMSKVVNSP